MPPPGPGHSSTPASLGGPGKMGNSITGVIIWSLLFHNHQQVMAWPRGDSRIEEHDGEGELGTQRSPVGICSHAQI